MQTMDTRWQCWDIAHNDRYIATIGTGFTVWDRSTLELVHHFTGLRSIHGGIFVNDDVLMIYTGEQKLFFFQISQKKLLWAVPRSRVLDIYGDMRCCHIPGTDKVACIARGKKSMEEHFLLVLDWSTQEICIHLIPDCYCAVSRLIWTPEFGMTFMTYQAKGDNVNLLYRIIRIDQAGNASILWDKESQIHVKYYSGHYLYSTNYHEQYPKASLYSLEQVPGCDHLQLGEPQTIPLPTRIFGIGTPLGCRRHLLPYVRWIDDDAGLLVACHDSEWIGLYDFRNNKMLVDLPHNKAIYGKVLDGNLLIGCASGFCIEPLGEKLL